MSKKKSSWDDIRFNVLFPFERVLIDTMDDQSISKSSWLSPSVWLGDLRECVSRSYPRNSLKECLTYWKLLEWQRTVLWIYLAAYSGAYESIGRELRFLVQDMSQAIVIDNEYRNLSLVGKVEEVPERIHERELINKLKISDDIRNKLREKWKVLCGYVHPSKEIVRTAISEVKFIFTFIQNQFDESLELFSGTMDLVFAILLGHFPKAIEGFIELQSKFRPLLKYDLFHHQYYNALNVCEAYCPESFKEPFFGHYGHDDISDLGD